MEAKLNESKVGEQKATLQMKVKEGLIAKLEEELAKLKKDNGT